MATAAANGGTAATPDLQTLLQQLTTERDALQTQNAQLWRLVDKQRTMIQGLQKDLDKYVTEEAERKAREKLASEPAVQAAATEEATETLPAVTPPPPTDITRETPQTAPLSARRVRPSPRSQDLSKLIENAPTKSPLRTSMIRTKEHVDDDLPELKRTTVPRRERVRSHSTPRDDTRANSTSDDAASPLALAEVESSYSGDSPAPDTDVIGSPDSAYSDGMPGIHDHFLAPSAEFSESSDRLSSSLVQQPLPQSQPPSSPAPNYDTQRRSSAASFAKAIANIGREAGGGPVIYGKNGLGTITVSHLSDIDVRLTQALLPSYSHLPTVMVLAVHFRDGTRIHSLKKQYSTLHRLAARFDCSMPPSSDFRVDDDLQSSVRKRMVDDFFADVLRRDLVPSFAEDLASFLSSSDMEVPAIFYPGYIASPVLPQHEAPSSQSTSDQASSLKEGYLSRRGKAFGAWKHRYFVLDAHELRMYDSDGSTVADTITLAGAQIGRQSEEKFRGEAGMEFKHAFLLLERKRNGMNRHILCAESDEDRESWVQALLNCCSELPAQQDDFQEDESPEFASVGYVSTTSRPISLQIPSQSSVSTEDRGISGPMHGAPINNAYAWGANPVSTMPLSPSARSMTSAASTNTIAATSASTTASITSTIAPEKKRKKPFWAKKKAESPKVESPQPPTQAALAAVTASAAAMSNAMRMNEPPRPVNTSGALFGMPLSEAIMRGGIDGVPAVVYRCIAFLEQRHMEREEGIYRLSGSSTAIRTLKERFNSELDVNLCAETHDIHAVAGLLKLYLRELPSTILPRDLQSDFLELVSMPDGPAKEVTIRTMVQSLPVDTLALLSHLCKHLWLVVRNENLNKMSLRNVGIVFSPTLNIPSNVLEAFISGAQELFADHEGQRSPLDGHASHEARDFLDSQPSTPLPASTHRLSASLQHF
ncbi:Rho GTPase activating protein [Savitreella phatthalungensis]